MFVVLVTTNVSQRTAQPFAKLASPVTFIVSQCGVPFTTQAALDSAYPNGNYGLTDGDAVTLSGNLYPKGPKVTQVNGALPVWNSRGQLKLDPTIANTLKWSAFSGSNFSTNGSEHVSPESEDGDDVDISEKAGISTDSSSAFTTLMIPANTLITGHTYTGYINYLEASTFTSPSANVYAAAGYATETYFTVIASPPSDAPQTVTFPAIANRSYSMQPDSRRPAR